MVRRRRRRKRLCACGASPAQQAGPSTSPLGDTGRPLSMTQVLITLVTVSGIFIGCILFEMGARYRIMLAGLYPEPNFRITPSPRHVAVLVIAVFLALNLGHHRTPYWSAVVFGIAFVVWLALFGWDVGREMARQRKNKESGAGVS